MVAYIFFIYDQTLIHIALIGGCLGYEEVILTSSQILSKLDLERLILVLRIRLSHIKSRIHQNCDRIFPYLGPYVYANAFLRIYSYVSGLKMSVCDPLIVRRTSTFFIRLPALRRALYGVILLIFSCLWG